MKYSSKRTQIQPLYTHYTDTQTHTFMLRSLVTDHTPKRALCDPVCPPQVRMQTRVANETNGFATLKRMLKTEGFTALTKGIAPKIWMTVPISAVTSICFELIMSLSRRKPSDL